MERKYRHRVLDIGRDLIGNVYANPYFWNNPGYFHELLSYIASQRQSYGRHMRKARPHLFAWLTEMLPELRGRSVATMCFWLLSGMTGYRKCPTCGNDIGAGQDISLTRGYSDYCCPGCSQRAWKTNDKRRQTLENDVKDDPDFFSKIRESVRRRNKAAGLPENFNNRSKARRTCMERYGVGVPIQDTGIRRRLESTKLRRYGDPNWTNRRKCRLTSKLRYGKENVWQVPEIRNKCTDTTVRRYGRANVMWKYEIDGFRFDSKPEFAFYVWLRDTGADFEAHPKTSFKYESAGRERRYFPDFRVGGKYVEIKGDQFFRPDGSMFCPYRRRGQSSEDYERTCDAYEAKRRCMETNGVIVMRQSDYAVYVRYCMSKYGTGFFESHRNGRFA